MRGPAVLGMALSGLLALGSGSAQAGSSVTQTTAWTYNSTTGLMTSETLQSTATSTSSCISGTGDNTCSVTTTYTRDSYGNITAATVSGTSLPTPLNGSGAAVSARTTSTAYDSQGEFATSTTNPLGQSESWTYDSRFGTPSSQTDANGLTTRWTYDAFGRRLTEARPDGTSSKWAYAGCGGGLACVANGAYQVQNSVYASGGSQAAPNSYTTCDTLGRVVETGMQAYNGATLTSSVVDTQYNSLGQVAQTGNPLFSGGTPVWTTYTYDVLDRVLTQVKPYGTAGSKTTYGYNGLTSTVTDAQSRVTTTTANDVGLPVSVQNAAGSTTTYAYDALGDLTQITDPAGNTTSYAYDVEGRKTAMTDPDRGSWTYAYDALGELIGQTDARNQVTTATYDALGRVLQRVQPDQTDGWVYDSASGGTAIGRLTSTQSYNNQSAETAKFSYVYDGYGRLTTTTGVNPLNSAAYSMTTGYDTGSRVSTVTYPSGYKVTDSYNGIGNLVSVAGLASGSSGSQTLWTLNSYSAAGQVVQQTLGDGIVVANTYDPNTMLLVATQAGLSSASQAGEPGSSNVANFSYAYDSLGNLTGRSDADADTPNTGTAPTPLSETLGYDNLYRLTSENLPGGATKTFGYDALGDLTYKSDTGTFAYANSAHVHAVSSIAGAGVYDDTTSYTYDADGNQLTGNGYSTTWTSFNKPLSIVQGSSTIGYVYDADHLRVAQSAPEGVTEYLQEPGTGVFTELFTPAFGSGNLTWTDYLFAGSQLIGIHVTPATGNPYTRFFIHDHLTSIAVVTGDIGCTGLALGGNNSCLAERDSYDAWGKRRSPLNWTDDVNDTLRSVTTRGYTQHEHVQDIGLIDMNARFYDPLTARFMATDPEIQDAGNLQDLDAYAYVINNPLSATDSTGSFYVCADSGGSCDGGGGGGIGGGGGGCASGCFLPGGGYQIPTVTITGTGNPRPTAWQLPSQTSGPGVGYSGSDGYGIGGPSLSGPMKAALARAIAYIFYGGFNIGSNTNLTQLWYAALDEADYPGSSSSAAAASSSGDGTATSNSSSSIATSNSNGSDASTSSGPASDSQNYALQGLEEEANQSNEGWDACNGLCNETNAENSGGTDVNSNDASSGTSVGSTGPVLQVAAAGDYQCQGFSAGCQNGGSWGTTGSYMVSNQILCYDCALKMLGLEDEPRSVQSETMEHFEIGPGD